MELQITCLMALLALVGGVAAIPWRHEKYEDSKSQDKQTFTSEDYEGEWQGDCALNSASGFPGEGAFTRYFVNTRSGGVVRYIFYEDTECQTPVYSFLAVYAIELGEVSETQSFTREAIIVFDKLLVRPESEVGAELLQPCNATVIGQDYDVTLSGCPPLGFQSTEVCIGDYELIRLVPGESFTAGFRTPNMCSPDGRPTRTQDDIATTPVRGA